MARGPQDGPSSRIPLGKEQEQVMVGRKSCPLSLTLNHSSMNTFFVVLSNFVSV